MIENCNNTRTHGYVRSKHLLIGPSLYRLVLARKNCPRSNPNDNDYFLVYDIVISTDEVSSPLRNCPGTSFSILIGIALVLGAVWNRLYDGPLILLGQLYYNGAWDCRQARERPCQDFVTTFTSEDIFGDEQGSDKTEHVTWHSSKHRHPTSVKVPGWDTHGGRNADASASQVNW